MLSKRLIAISILFLTIIVGYVLYTYSVGNPSIKQADEVRTSVVAAAVIEDKFIEQIEALGTAKANESVDITTNVTEKVSAIHFNDGMQVKTGDILVALEKTEEEAQLDSELANLAEQERELRRLKQLVEQKTIPQAQYDERATMHEIAKFRVEEARSRVKNRVIRAPFDGILGLRNVSLGTLVSPGYVITTLDDISTIKLDFSVPSSFLSTLKIGLPIIAISDAYGPQRFIGEITTIDSRIDPITRSITARAEIPNANGLLKPGLLMKVTLIKDARDTLIIPEEALVPEQEQHYVFIVDPEDDNKIIRQLVEIGGRRPGEVEIVDGLYPDQWVVIRGTSRVRPGEYVAVNNLTELAPIENTL